MCHNLKALTWMLLLLHIGYTVDVCGRWCGISNSHPTKLPVVYQKRRIFLFPALLTESTEMIVVF